MIRTALHSLAVAALAGALASPLAAAGADGQQVPGAHFIENWDLDEDGQVTLAETTQKRADIFYMFDQDENGSLDDAEYDLFDETRQADIDANAGGPKGQMRGLNQAMMRDFNDRDSDGSVTEAEFLEGAADLFLQMDRNKDGVITTADFGPPGSMGMGMGKGHGGGGGIGHGDGQGQRRGAPSN